MRASAMKHLTRRLGILRTAGALLYTVIASCGFRDLTGADLGPPLPDEVPATPSCAPDEVAVAALLDGISITERATLGRFRFQQLRPPATLDIDRSPITLHLEWRRVLGPGESTRARGWTRGSGFDVGHCGAVPFSGTITLDADGGGGRFLLWDLQRTAHCAGPVESGVVAGCWRNRPFR